MNTFELFTDITWLAQKILSVVMNNLHFQDFTQNSVNPNNDFRPPNQVGDQSHLFASGETRSRGETGQRKNFFSFQFYQQYFDVDTDQVLSRILNSMVPRMGSNFITDHIQPLPDLWGPFWISVTLVFSTAICGNLAKYIQTSGDVTNHQYGSDFRLVTGASTIIFCYVVLVPFLLYSLFWYRKSDLQYSYLDILCAYGYSLSVFVPVSILWVLQAQWFRWMLIILSVTLSGAVLVSSIWPAVKSDRNRSIALGTIVGILLLHSLLAVGFKEYYFDSSVPSRLETEDFREHHQQVRTIEHSDMKLNVSTAETNSSVIAEEEKGSALKKEENNMQMKATNAAQQAPTIAANISKPT